MIGADLVSVGYNGETEKQTRAAGRPSWGRKKGNGRKWSYLYDDKWWTIFPAVPATHTHIVLPTFSLSRVSTFTIVDLNRDLPLPSLALLIHSFPCSLLLLSCPCHLIFSHPPHTRQPTKRHQSHHPIPS